MSSSFKIQQKPASAFLNYICLPMLLFLATILLTASLLLLLVFANLLLVILLASNYVVL